jgi:hypothetical protein
MKGDIKMINKQNRNLFPILRRTHRMKCTFARAKQMAKNFGPVWFGFLFGSLLLTVVFSSEIAAQRDDGTPAHNFGVTWSLRQSNGFTVTMNLKQNSRGEITGTATANARNGVSRGTVTGRAWRQNGASWQSTVDHFQVEIAWNGPTGVYKASASWSEGILRGETYQKDKPSARAGWTAGPFARRR